MSAVITVKNFGKRYVIGHQRNGSDGLRHAVEDAVRNPLKWMRDRRKTLRATREEFWALKDVSFEVKQGEVVGIIGRNGAGKSTLLKILSRITEPTTGTVRIKGRVASLLEVGTGFHPELTGRENTFLNGAILGMRREEIKRKFDEIVSFSGVEKFIDTPVKRYSSGMYVRLAFAIAAHLEPEILIVDEVLAVGDAEFQKKCLGKMKDASSSDGRTVLFVSHNMPAVQQLCSRGILFHEGRLVMEGDTASAVNAYLHSLQKLQEATLRDRRDREGDRRLRFVNVTLHDSLGREIASTLCGQAVRIRLHYESDFNGEEHEADVAFKVRNESGAVVTGFANIQTGPLRLPVFRVGYFECLWPKTNLRAGNYDCALFCAIDGSVCDWLQNAFTLEIEDGDYYGTGNLVSRAHGDVLCDQLWSSSNHSHHVGVR